MHTSDDTTGTLPSNIAHLLTARRRPDGQMPLAQTLRSSYASLFNFPPSNFSFYQHPPLNSPSPLTENLLRGAFHFDGHCCVSNSHLKVVDGVQTTPLSALTLELWVNLSASGSTLFKLQDKGGTYLQLSNGGNLQLTFNYVTNSGGATSVNTITFTSGTSIADGFWHHLAVVVTPDRKVHLYVDTRVVQLSGTATLSGLLTDGGTLYVGNNSTSTSSSTGTAGYFGQIRLWQTARTLSQIVTSAGTALGFVDDSALSLYWNNELQIEQKTIGDSSSKGNPGTVTLPSQPPDTWWDSTTPYGALADADHMTAHPVNMTGCLSLDRFQHQRIQVTSDRLMLDNTAQALTIEFWVQAASDNHATAVMLALELQSSGGDSRDLIIYNPDKVSLQWGSHQRESGMGVTNGAWHHVAMVWDWHNPGTASWTLYIDAKLVLTESSAWTPLVGSSPWLLLGGNGGSDSTRYLSGCMAELRIWQSARTADEVLSDASYRLLVTPPELRLYWPFARDFTQQGLVEDYSAYNCTGTPLGSPTWRNDLVYGVFANHMLAPPTPAASSVGGLPATGWSAGNVSVTSADGMLDGAAAGFPRVSETELRQAYAQAQASGYFDKRYFPNIHGIHSDRDHRHAKKAIEHIDVQIFLAYWQMGRRLDLVKRDNGHYASRFIPAPTNSPTARLMLVETYQLTAFLGDIHEGQVVRTFTLMPGETTHFSINTYKNSTTNSESASSIFDSYDEASQASFESALTSDQTTTTSEAAELSFYATADVKQRWGTGNADVTTGATIDGNLSHSNFFQQTTNAIANHAAQASSARNVEVNTSFSVQDETGRQTALTREVRNINSSRTLDLVFRQLTQEYLTVLHLTDIRIGYYDPNPGSFRVVGLAQLDSLLDQVVVDSAEVKLATKQAIVNQVLGLVALGQGTARDAMVTCSSKSTGMAVDLSSVQAGEVTDDQVFSVNPRCDTDVWYTETRSVRVSGLAMASTSVQLRTDNVVAEAVIGRGIGLDAFALGLQAQQLQRSQLDNELLKAEAEKLRLANEIVANGDTAKAALYAQIFAPPRINNNVLYADETGRSGGQAA